MISTYFLPVLMATYACAVNGQSRCTTPLSSNGLCVAIQDCEVFLKILKNDKRTAKELQFIKESNCGLQGDTVRVCCPVECTTPDGEAGKCISIYSCPHLAGLQRPPVSRANQIYVEKSKCKGSEPYSVCCGPAPTSTSQTYNTRPIAVTNINDKCSAQLSAFPLDSNSECCGRESTIENKIVGGNATSIDMYPWLALIKYDTIEDLQSKFICGGALISARFVLTAAHCIGNHTINTIGRPTHVRLGEYDISNPGKDCVEVESSGIDCTDGEIDIEISKLLIYPIYTVLSRQNDIGLIKLASSAPYTDFIRPICLPTYDITLNPPPPENFTLYAAGWGATENATHSNLKLHVALPFVELQECQKSLRGPNLKSNLRNSQLCAGGQTKDTCNRDSGGPLMYENGYIFEVIGVVNFGPKPCGTSGIPGVYSKVFAYLDWIRETISDNQ